MNYENASDIIPEKLLKEIQKYAQENFFISLLERKKGLGREVGLPKSITEA